MLYASLGIPSTLVKKDKKDGSRISYAINIQTDRYVRIAHDHINKYPLKKMYQNITKSCSHVHIVNGQMIAPVKRNRSSPYRGQVYNLEVEEDNSYTLQACVHNCQITDAWMQHYTHNSVFRPFFKFLTMPTVDDHWQAEEWIEDYLKADLVLSYTDFGIHTLKKHAPLIKIFPKPMRTGVDLNVIKPLDKQEIRKKYLLRPDVPIIGFVSRNQRRKLFLDVIDAFALMKNKYAAKHEAVNKAILLLHTSWPDNAFSFNYPRHILRLHRDAWRSNYRKGIKDDILQTLMCLNDKCQKYSVGHAVMLWNKPIENGRIKQYCKHCGQMTAVCPTSGGNSFSREGLNEVYNLCDVGVQCAIAEGDSITVTEFKAAGVPVIVSDNAALIEKGRFPHEFAHIDSKNYSVHHGGTTHKVKTYIHEPETGCYRAMPDINDLAEKMKMLLVDDELRNDMSIKARKCAEENYDWDKLAKQWEFVFDNITPKDRSQTWDTPIIIKSHSFPESIPDGLDDNQFIEWLYLKILKYPKVDTVGAQQWIMNLQNGVTREQLFEQFKQIASSGENSENIRQRIRASVAKMKGEDYVDESKESNESEWI
jgi:glycosyltransferase involved in cell wall biosynthesis